LSLDLPIRRKFCPSFSIRTWLYQCHLDWVLRENTNIRKRISENAKTVSCGPWDICLDRTGKN
jgi:hypothetical protein